MTHVMIDLETLGLLPGCAILSIGAIQFDLDADKVGDSFYINVSRESCLHYGLWVDPQTEAWWASQSQEAKDALENPEPVNLSNALLRFAEWLTMMAAAGPVSVWSHGAGFDLPILHIAAAKVQQKMPWGYRNERDTRTLFMVAAKQNEIKFQSDIAPFKVGVHHNALDDAVTQARQIQMSWDIIQGLKGLID